MSTDILFLKQARIITLLEDCASYSNFNFS